MSAAEQLTIDVQILGDFPGNKTFSVMPAGGLNTSLGELRRLIFESSTIPSNEQHIICMGRVLKDDATTLAAQRIKPPRAKLMIRHVPTTSSSTPTPAATASVPSTTELKHVPMRPLPMPAPPIVVPVGAPLPPVAAATTQPPNIITAPTAPNSATTTPIAPVQPPLEAVVRDPFPGAPAQLNARDISNIFSWGQGKTGRLGHGDQQPLLFPTRIEEFRGRQLHQVVAGGMHSVAVDVEGNVYFWGTFHMPPEKKEDSSSMHFGRHAGRHAMAFDDDDDPDADAGGRGGLAARGGGNVLIGGGLSAALSASATTASGSSDDHREGKTHTGTQLTPLLMEEISSMKLRITQLAAGSGHTLLLTDLGEVWSFGDGSSGQLGHQIYESCRTPKRVEALRVALVRSIAAGALHSLALDEDGKVWSWGQNKKGQLGHGNLRSTHTPTRVESLIHSCHMIDAGSQHSIAVLGATNDASVAGGMYVWGGGRSTKAIRLSRWLSGNMESDDDERDRLAAEESRRKYLLNLAAERALAAATRDLDDVDVFPDEPSIAAVSSSIPSSSSTTAVGSSVERPRTPPLTSAARRPLSLAELREGKGEIVDDDDSGDEDGVEEKATMDGAAIRQLSSLGDVTLVLTDGGEVWKWNILRRPKRIRDLASQHVVSIHAGLGYMAALLASGVVLAKGKNDAGQCGLGYRTDPFARVTSFQPIPAFIGQRVHQLACGPTHMLALTTGSSLANDLANTIGDARFADLRLHCKNRFVAAHRLLWAVLPTEWLHVLTRPELLHVTPSSTEAEIGETKGLDTQEATSEGGLDEPSSTQLDDDMADSKLPTLQLKHLDGDVVAYVLRYLYASALHGQVNEVPPRPVPKSIAKNVLRLAQLLNHQTLINKCDWSSRARAQEEKRQAEMVVMRQIEKARQFDEQMNRSRAEFGLPARSSRPMNEALAAFQHAETGRIVEQTREEALARLEAKLAECRHQMEEAKRKPKPTSSHHNTPNTPITTAAFTLAPVYSSAADAEHTLPTSAERSAATFTDVTFIVEDAAVHAHKVILCGRSEYFRSMFSSRMVESRERLIPLPDMPLSIFKLLLQFMYTDAVTLPTSSVLGIDARKLLCAAFFVSVLLMQAPIELMHGARLYQLEGLMILLEEYMLTRVVKDNVAVLYRVATNYSLPLLRDTCVRYMVHNLSSVQTSPDFGRLPNVNVLLEELKLTRRALKKKGVALT